jgi:protease secretion system membrane fusion protein
MSNATTAADTAPLQDTHHTARLGGWLLLGALLAFALWAALAPLDQGVPVAGTVVVAGSRQTVQHPLGGVIERIAVRDGDQVSAGQLLVQINASQAQAQRQALQVQYINARASTARLQAEQDGLSRINFDPTLLAEADLPWARDALNQQQHLLTLRQHTLRLELAALDQNVATVQASQAGQRSALLHLKASGAALLEQLQRLRELAREGYVPSNRVLDNERIYAQHNATLAEAQGNLTVTTQQARELQLRIEQRQAEHQRDIRQQFSEQQAKADELGNRLRSADYELTQARLLAPASGTVVGLQVFTEGGVIAPGQQLMEIVPQDAPLLIDAQAPVELVDKLRPGLPVELMFSAFNQSTTARVSGELTLVSADRLIDQNSRQPYYQMRIRVSDDGLRQLKGFDIRPGMPVQAFVRTGERSLLNYLFKPLTDRLHTALVEE